MKLDKHQIVTEALALLNEGGLKNVSLRNIAARLDAKAPSLAWHVGDKQNLLCLMSEQVFRKCLNEVSDCTTWQMWLKQFAFAVWRAQSTTRDFSLLIASSSPKPDRVDFFMTEMLESIATLGLSKDVGMRMQLSVYAMVLGWTTIRQSPNGKHLDSIMPHEESVRQSVDFLIAGWESYVGGLSLGGRPA